MKDSMQERKLILECIEIVSQIPKETLIAYRDYIVHEAAALGLEKFMTILIDMAIDKNAPA